MLTRALLLAYYFRNLNIQDNLHLHQKKYPSIHSLPLIQGRSRWQQAKYSRSPSPQQRFPAPPSGSLGVPRPDEICNPSNVSAPGSPTSWTCPFNASALRMSELLTLSLMLSLHYTILALIFHSATVFGDRRQKPKIRGESALVSVSDNGFV